MLQAAWQTGMCIDMAAWLRRTSCDLLAAQTSPSLFEALVIRVVHGCAMCWASVDEYMQATNHKCGIYWRPAPGISQRRSIQARLR